MLLRKLQRLVGATLLLLGMSLTLGFAQDYPRYEENALFVKFKDQSAISAKKLQAKGGAQIQTRMLGISDKLIERYKILPEAEPLTLFNDPALDRTFRIEVHPEAKISIDELIKELEKNPDIEYVERVPACYIFGQPTSKAPATDPFYGRVGAQQMNTSWHLDLINAEKAWELQTGNPDLIVAVVDNAIWGEHEDLQIPSSLQYNNTDRVTGNSAPPVGKAIQDATCSIEDIYASSCVAYEWSHGTHCAGAIAAINNNGKGIASIGSGVSLMGVGCPYPQAPISVYDAYRGVRWAAEHGAKLISCSWGGSDYSRASEDIMRVCYEQGIIIVAAAGNDNISTPHYPSAYTPYVISVGSVDANRRKSSFSNYGPWVDIVAPGGVDSSKIGSGIFSTTFCKNQYSRLIHQIDDFKDSYYDEMSGTSMATPVLSGVIALMLSKDSTLTTEQIRTILQNTGQDVASNYYFNSNCKVVDAYAALKFMNEYKGFGPKIALDSLTTRTAHDSVWLEWKAPETTETIVGYNVYRNGDRIAEHIKTPSYVDTNVSPGLTRYAVEPVYENLASVRTEVDVKVKTYYRINVVIRPDSSYGRVVGAGSYEENTLYILTAIPNEGYEFDYWMDARGSQYRGLSFRGPALKSLNMFAFFKSPTANEDLNPVAKALRISPNPASESVRIQCDEYEMNAVRICDLTGKEMFHQTMAAHDLTVRIANWPIGTYIIYVSTPEGSTSQKLIKR